MSVEATERPAWAVQDNDQQAPNRAAAGRRVGSGVLRRLAAYGVDLIAVAAVVAAVYLPTRSLVLAGVVAAEALVGLVLWEARTGRTLGKSLLGIRAAQADAPYAPGLGRELIRAALLGAAHLVAFVGQVVLIATAAADRSGRGQALHDRAAGTAVIDIRPSAVARPAPIPALAPGQAGTRADGGARPTAPVAAGAGAAGWAQNANAGHAGAGAANAPVPAGYAPAAGYPTPGQSPTYAPNGPASSPAPWEQSRTPAPTGIPTGAGPTASPQSPTGAPSTSAPWTGAPAQYAPQSPSQAQPQYAQPPQQAQPRPAQTTYAQPQAAQGQYGQPQAAQGQDAQPQSAQGQQGQYAQPHAAQGRPQQGQYAQPGAASAAAPGSAQPPQPGSGAAPYGQPARPGAAPPSGLPPQAPQPAQPAASQYPQAGSGAQAVRPAAGSPAGTAPGAPPIGAPSSEPDGRRARRVAQAAQPEASAASAQLPEHTFYPRAATPAPVPGLTDAPAQSVGSDRRGAPPSAVYVLTMDDGATVTVTGSGLLGRRPQAPAGERYDHLVAIDDPGRSLSRTHARFGIDDGELWVEDRGSANGTLVVAADGTQTRAFPGKRVRVPEDGSIELGERVITVARWES